MNKLFALFLVAVIAGCGQMVEFPDAPANDSDPDSGNNDTSDLPCDCLDGGDEASSSLSPVLVGAVHTFDGGVEEVDSGVVVQNDSGLEQDSDVSDSEVVDTSDSSVEDSGVQVDDASVSEDAGSAVDSGSVVDSGSDDDDDSGVCSNEGLTCEQKLHCCMNACKAAVHDTKCKEHVECVHACAHEHKVCVFKRLPHSEQVRLCNLRH